MNLERFSRSIQERWTNFRKELYETREIRKNALAPHDKVVLTAVSAGIFLAGTALNIDEAKAFGIGMAISTHLE